MKTKNEIKLATEKKEKELLSLLNDKNIYSLKIILCKYWLNIEKIIITIKEYQTFDTRLYPIILNYSEKNCEDYGDITEYQIKQSTFFEIPEIKDSLVEQIILTFNIDS